MPELTHHDLADDGFHEIQLSGKQLVFLFMATTIVAVVIFLCGVQVGRGVRTERVADANSNPDPVAAGAQPPVAVTTSSSSSAAPPAAEPPAPAQESDEPLSYPERLQSAAPPKEQLKPRNEPAPAPVQTPMAGTPVKNTPPPPAPTSASSSEGAQGKTFDGTQGKSFDRAQDKSAVSAPVASRSGVWVIQVHALKDRAAAAAIAHRLTAKGYPAFVLDPSAGAPAIYRVQVGRYNDRRDADQVARRLEKEEQFKPWVQH